jgi:glycosyltransferase involved in cell wall biosynthesis
MSDKPTLLYASPFPPMKSGISDYSVELVRALSGQFEITLYTDDYDINDDSVSEYPAVKNSVDNVDFDSYDYIIYNIGNNLEFHSYIYEAAIKHPGMIILHDLMIYYLFVGLYTQKKEIYSKVYSSLGMEDYLKIKHAVKSNGRSLREQKQLSSEISFNKELLSSGNKIMVHSEYSKNKILETGLIAENKVRKIEMVNFANNENYSLIDKDSLFEKFNIPKDAIVVASLGFIVWTKMNKEVCRAVKEIASYSDKKICYVMVGDGNYADDELKPDVVIKTGYTNIDEFNSFINYSDIIVSLRGTTMGETSGAIVRILQSGKCCITNNIGWFAELPDDCVVKIDLSDVEGNLKSAISDLIENPEKKKTFEKNAKEYIERDYAPDLVAEKIKDFLIEG